MEEAEGGAAASIPRELQQATAHFQTFGNGGEIQPWLLSSQKQDVWSKTTCLCEQHLSPGLRAGCGFSGTSHPGWLLPLLKDPSHFGGKGYQAYV